MDSKCEHTERAMKHFMDSGAVVILVEVAFNRREFAFENSGLDGTAANCKVIGSDRIFRHRWIGLRSRSELWLKENMFNVAIGHLPFDWQQVCILDSDVHFLRPNWVGECIHKLQHYDVLQMFSHARDLGPDYEMLPEDYPHANGVSWVKSWVDGDLEENLRNGFKVQPPNANHTEGDYYGAKRVFPGLAWVLDPLCHRQPGRLIDWAIWGGGDWHMAHALIGKTDSTILERSKQYGSERHLGRFLLRVH